MYQTDHAFKLFSADIKSEKMANVILLYGREPFLFKWAYDTLISKYVNPGMESMDSRIIYEDELEGTGLVDAIIEACETMPLISEKKVVWVRDPAFLNSGDRGKALPKEDKERLLAYMEDPADSCILMFSSEDFDVRNDRSGDFFKRVYKYDMDKLDGKSLRQFVNKRFKNAGVEVTPGELSLLVNECGYFNRDSDYDLYRMEKDIEKLISVSPGGRLPKGAIEALVIGDEETYVFDLIDSIIGKRKDKALTILNNNLTAGSDEFGLLELVTRQFEMMLSVQTMLDRGYSRPDMVKKLKAKDFTVKKLIPFATKFQQGEIENILSRLYEIDRDIKMGVMDGPLALELFIASI